MRIAGVVTSQACRWATARHFRSFHRSARPAAGLTSHSLDHCTARLGRRPASPRTLSIISPLGSAGGRPHLALSRSFHRSARPAAGLTSHSLDHFTARLGRRPASPRTLSIISPLGSARGRPHLPLSPSFHRPAPPAARPTSHPLRHFSTPPRPPSGPPPALSPHFSALSSPRPA